MTSEFDAREIVEMIIEELEKGESANFKRTVDMVEELYRAEEFDYLADLIEDELPKNTSDYFFSEIISRADSNKGFTEEMVGLLQENPYISPKDLETIHVWSDLIWDDKRCGTATAAINPRTPSDILMILSRHKDEDFRYRVAINKGSTNEVISSLVDYETGRTWDREDNSSQMLFQRHLFIQIAVREDVSDSTLLKIAEFTNNEVVRAVILTNPNSSDKTKEVCRSRGYDKTINLAMLRLPIIY